LISGHVDEATHEMTAKAEAAAFLIKPFSRDGLLAAITKALDFKKSPD
jgi:FixJ family two-component response regulator